MVSCSLITLWHTFLKNRMWNRNTWIGIISNNSIDIESFQKCVTIGSVLPSSTHFLLHFTKSSFTFFKKKKEIVYTIFWYIFWWLKFPRFRQKGPMYARKKEPCSVKYCVTSNLKSPQYLRKHLSITAFQNHLINFWTSSSLNHVLKWNYCISNKSPLMNSVRPKRYTALWSVGGQSDNNQ